MLRKYFTCYIYTYNILHIIYEIHYFGAEEINSAQIDGVSEELTGTLESLADDIGYDEFDMDMEVVLVLISNRCYFILIKRCMNE